MFQTIEFPKNCGSNPPENKMWPVLKDTLILWVKKSSRIILTGHSLGCPISYLYARKLAQYQPNPVDGLIGIIWRL